MVRWFVALGLAVTMGCGQAPSEDQCKRLLDHVVDLELKKAGTAAGSAAVDLAKIKESVGTARSADFMDQCTSKISRSRVECALDATSVECPDDKKDCGTSLADCDAK